MLILMLVALILPVVPHLPRTRKGVLISSVIGAIICLGTIAFLAALYPMARSMGGPEGVTSLIWYFSISLGAVIASSMSAPRKHRNKCPE
jgi:hypothetical protein